MADLKGQRIGISENSGAASAAALQEAALGIEQLAEHSRAKNTTKDSFQNFLLNLGMGVDNATSFGTYGFSPISRNRTQLEWIHRGSWLGGIVVDAVADDMTKAGIEITSTMPPDDVHQLDAAAVNLGIWNAINDTAKWARLYGGAIAVMLIDGQDFSTPLQPDRIGKGQFRGLLSLDRWMVDPSFNERVEELGPDLGMPKYYRVLALAPALHNKNIHYSRVLRMDGIRLPYWQRYSENMWGISVLERLYDRMIGFDTATAGAVQLVGKAYLRSLKIKGYRQLVAGPPEMMQVITQYVDAMRRFQGIEGVTVYDADDEFEAHQPSSFSGINEVLMQLGQQIAGASQIPLVRLFGMSPAGFNATGDSDLEIYYSGINQRQEKEFRVPVTKIYRMIGLSEGISIPDDFGFIFRSLYTLKDEDKANIADRVTAAIVAAKDAAIISDQTALKELRQSSRTTGIWSNITDEQIESAEDEPPAPDLFGADVPGNPEGEGAGGAGGGQNMPGVSANLPGREKRLRLVKGGGAAADAEPPSHFELVPGLAVVIETPRGAMRPPHQVPMPASYGYIRGTEAPDGDEIDCFIGPELDSQNVWIINQVDPDTGAADEPKCMIAYPSRVLALRDYQRSFDDGSGAARIGGVRQMTMEQFKAWLQDGARAHAA